MDKKIDIDNPAVKMVIVRYFRLFTSYYSDLDFDFEELEK